MKLFVLVLMLGSFLQANNFTLESDTLKGQLTKQEEFNGFGCHGENRSPELHWSNAPKGTKSFAITVFDPDAPTGSGWWHWIVVNIPANVKEIPQDASAKHLLPKGAIETMTDFGKPGFGGPCPPKGDKPHRYIFTVYALDTEKLDVKPSTDSAHVGYLINQHAIAKSSLISYYGR
jgi:Raf kinase inhibitor-like YbhB/YbcL family protein